GFTYTVTGPGATPVVTITHTGADDATVNAMLNSAVFNNTTNNAPSTTARTVTFTNITDSGSGTTADGTLATVDVTTVNDAPSFGDENSPTTFYDHTISTDSVFRNVYSNIFSIDLDQDGYMDVLANTTRTGKLVWFENENGTGNFTEHNIDMAGATGRFTDIYSADIDDDGDLDLVVVTNSQLSWLENDGSQNFSWHLIDSLGDGLSSVSATDFDGDGHMEIVSASSNNDTIAWYKNNNEVFTRNVLTSTAEGAATVVTADVDSDGNTDIVYASSDDDTIAWYRYLGGDTFSTEKIVTTTSDGAYGVTVADMDSDGHMDMVAVASDSYDIELYVSNDDSTAFSKYTISDLNFAANPRPVATGDFDGDGDLDVMASSAPHDQMSWYENTGGHNYTEHMFTQSVYGAKSIAVADINNDGKLDVLSASYYDEKIAWHENIITTLDGVPDYTEDDPPVVLDADVE
ncbi:MAG: VCBS repeat-containing protein, partial [Desulfobacterales bacterium]|nr:VCBS repeat-containing protein [Desulfobacterales bacterium]